MAYVPRSKMSREQRNKLRAYQREQYHKNKKPKRLKRAVPPHLDHIRVGDEVMTVQRGAAKNGGENKYWRDLVVAQQNTIARLLTIIEASVEVHNGG